MPKDAKALRRLEGSKLLRLNRGLSRLRFTATHLKHHHPTFSLLLLASECVLKLSALWRMRATLGLACASRYPAHSGRRPHPLGLVTHRH